jgi:hypothetical protein
MNEQLKEIAEKINDNSELFGWKASTSYSVSWDKEFLDICIKVNPKKFKPIKNKRAIMRLFRAIEYFFHRNGWDSSVVLTLEKGRIEKENEKT